MKIIKNVGLVVCGIILSFVSFINQAFGSFYERIFGRVQGGGGFDIGPSPYQITEVVGMIPSFLFISVFLLTVFGDKYKYYWIGVLMLPVLWFVFKLDLAHWYFYLALALAGWGLGWLIHSIVRPKLQG